MSDCLGPSSQSCWGEKAQSWLGIWGQLTRCTGQADYLQGHESYPRFGLLTWRPGRSSSILDLGSSFNTSQLS